YAQTEAPYGYDYRLASIEYTAKVDGDGKVVEPGKRSVELFYEDRADPLFLYQAGVRRGVHQRLRRIMLHAPYPGGHVGPMGSYWLTYTQSATTGKSLLAAVTRDDGDTALWTRRFEWAEQERPAFDKTPLALQAGSHGRSADIDGDGKGELLFPAWLHGGDTLSEW